MRGKQEMAKRQGTSSGMGSGATAESGGAGSGAGHEGGGSVTMAAAAASAEAVIEPDPELIMPFTRDSSGSSSFARPDLDRYPMPDIPEVSRKSD